MHDPCTQAFDIKYPWPKDRKPGPFGKYHASFITVWHVDPEKHNGRVCRRSDDTCGWSTPNPTKEEYEAIRKLARREYGDIFGQQVALRDKKSYASVCNVPELFDATYWIWRSLKHHFKKKVLWKYGTDISFKEMQRIIQLNTCPVDNIRNSFREVKDEDSFVSFFMCVYRCYSRFHRPWYKHPKWHFWHWKIQFHPYQNLRRKYWLKCDKCGKRGFGNKYPIGNWAGTSRWHEECDDTGNLAAAYQARKAAKEANA